MKLKGWAGVPHGHDREIDEGEATDRENLYVIQNLINVILMEHIYMEELWGRSFEERFKAERGEGRSQAEEAIIEVPRAGAQVFGTSQPTCWTPPTQWRAPELA